MKKIKPFVRHKYAAKRCEYQGIKFPSTLERDCFIALEELKKAGKILFTLRQCPVHLPGNVRHVIDFFVFTPDNAYFVEAKGRDLKIGADKRKMVEDLLNVQVHVVKSKSDVYRLFSES